MIAYCELEILKFKENMNHFQLKNRLYIQAVKAAFSELQNIKAQIQTIDIASINQTLSLS